MPYLSVRNLQIYYETDGDPAAPPLLLIHGSGGTGGSNWQPVRALLARHFFLLLPDCRGHGRTLAPRNEYTFSLLAADLAAFLGALGVAPAFVAGHSNGGNVALLLCAEQPQAVRRAVLMAANAYPSPDLRRYALEDWSERIERDSPGWAGELAAAHDPGRFPGYWRDLMRRTGYEIGRAPDFSPADLARIRTPALVIQGERDPVNAPGGHADFLYEHLAEARLWLAAGLGHNVHRERPDEWARRVTAFLLNGASQS